MRIHRAVACLISAIVLAGCASRPINEPITQVDPEAGYRPYLLIPKIPNNHLHTFFVLSFSGGGTRAAALSYGVLGAPSHRDRRRWSAPPADRRGGHDHQRVGGKFHRARVALYGNQLFSEYEARFLKRDVQGALLAFTLTRSTGGGSSAGAQGVRSSPRTTTTRSCSAAQPSAICSPSRRLWRSRPVPTSRRDRDSPSFRTIRPDCSDLNKVRLSRAAATSSAVPVVLSAVTFNNYGGSCGYQYPAWVKESPAQSIEPGRRGAPCSATRKCSSSRAARSARTPPR